MLAGVLLPLNRKMRRLAKMCMAVTLALVAMMYLYSLRFPADPKPGPSGDDRKYKNSDSLVQKLKPKIKQAKLPKEEADEPADPIWAELSMVRDAEDVRIREEGYKKFAFNTLVSSRLDLVRPLPDTRHRACPLRNRTGSMDPELLPSASVIICFYHEELRVLLRTVHTVVERSKALGGRQLLKEVILVDDHSDIEITPQVEENLKQSNLTGLVRVVRPPERLGLIRARIHGSRLAVGDVLVFLDSHVEPNVGWLEPLLERIRTGGRSTVVTPIIDIISADTFLYRASPLVRGGFNWGLNFKWDSIPKEELSNEADFVRPFRSPTMAGGLFAIDRRYFQELGEYDPGLEVWGGENLEISFRIWMCGGTLEIVPCSRVGHIFRKRRPYGNHDGRSKSGTHLSEEDTMTRNSLRVAKVWMDEYIEFFYLVNPSSKGMDPGDLAARQDLKKRLGCRPFKWYLENVYPSYDSPPSKAMGGPKGDADFEDRKLKKLLQQKASLVPWQLRKRRYRRAFSIQLADQPTGSTVRLCVRSRTTTPEKQSELILAECPDVVQDLDEDPAHLQQVWYDTDRFELVLAKLLCLEAHSKAVRRPFLNKCHELGAEQEWKFRERQGRFVIFNMATGFCLGTPQSLGGRDLVPGAKLEMSVCSEEKSYMWLLRYHDNLAP